MASVVEVREATASFDLTVPDSMPEVGVDGVSNALLGFPNSKVVFHVLTLPKKDSNVEQRKAVLSLSMNTLALVQFCQQVIGALASSHSQLAAAAAQFESQLREIAGRASPTQSGEH